MVDKFADEKEIYVYDYGDDRPTDKEGYEAKGLQIQGDFYEAVENPDIRTIGIDTETDLWETRRLAKWGRAASIPLEFTSLNKDMRMMVEAVNHSGKNLILISEMKKKYVDVVDAKGRSIGHWDGTYEPAGWSGVDYKVQINLLSEFDPIEHIFKTTIINNGLNQLLAGEELEGEMNNFAFLGLTTYPDSDESDWR